MPGLGAAAVKALAALHGTMERLRERVRGRRARRRAARASCCARPATSRRCEAERTIEAQGRIENLEELVGVAARVRRRATAEERSLDEFLQQIALVADADTRGDDEGLVTLMTLHNAKGLEYPIVFMIGCEEGVFPHSRALEEGELEEERRLCYVGITRAERDLYLTYARRDAVRRRSFGAPSRFVDEIPVELTDRDEPGAARLRRDPAPRAAVVGAARRDVAGGRPRRAAAAALPDRRRRRAADVRRGRGDGVEPGGIVVIRFAGDGSERKLIADLRADHEALSAGRVIDGDRPPCGADGAAAPSRRSTADAARPQRSDARPDLPTAS